MYLPIENVLVLPDNKTNVVAGVVVNAHGTRHTRANA